MKRSKEPLPFLHQRSKSHYDNAGGRNNNWDQHQPQQNPFGHSQDEQQHFQRQFPQQQQHPNDPPPSVRRIQIRQEKPRAAPGQFVEINNAQPNYSNGAHLMGGNQQDKRRRFSNAENDHNYANRSASIPNITIEDYDDGKMGREEEEKQPSPPIPTVIPLPAPAIPLPAPEGMMPLKVDEKMEDFEPKVEPEEEESHGNYEKDYGQNMKEDYGQNMKEDYGHKMKEDYGQKVKEDYGQKVMKEEANAINFVPVAQSGDHLVRILDETERKVESLREVAAKLEQEKETLLDMIKNIKLTGGLLKLAPAERDELELNTDRILTRCRTVDVCVNTPRDEHQSRALEHVNEVIQSVIERMHADLASAKIKARGFLNACMPDESGHVDEKFQSLIIACTADDQKKIRRRLVQLIEQIENAQQFVPNAQISG